MYIMPANIITTDDLREFKTELIEQLKDIISTPRGTAGQKRFLKTSELQEALGSFGIHHSSASNHAHPSIHQGQWCHFL
jgi:hypothetical protein